MFGLRQNRTSNRLPRITDDTPYQEEVILPNDDLDAELDLDALELLPEPGVKASTIEPIPFALSIVPSHTVLDDHKHMYEEALKDLCDAKNRLMELAKDTQARIDKVSVAINAAEQALGVITQTRDPKKQEDPGAAGAAARARLRESKRSREAYDPAAIPPERTPLPERNPAELEREGD